MTDQLMKEALTYFNGDTGFHRLFSLFKAKYESYGRIGGSVKIGGFNEADVGSIARFYGLEPAALKSKGRVTLLSFERKLKETKYESIDLKSLLEAYFEVPLVSKKEAEYEKKMRKDNKILELSTQFPELTFWFEYLQKRTADTYWIHRLMMSEDRFSECSGVLAKALEHLPEDFERLPVFSQRINGNPHSFDLTSELGKLWIHVLTIKKGEGVPPSDTEKINDLLLEYKLLRDDITNYVTIANLTSDHPMWMAAAETSSVMNVPMRELLKIRRAYPKNNLRAVWVVENSGVFSSLLDEVPDAPLICTHGQFKLAGLKLLDMIAASKYRIYYAGDFDPEGLTMAVRLKQRYPEAVHYWRMDTESYLNSGPSVPLAEDRLAKLNRFPESGLLEVAAEMQLRKMAGYQEALLKVMAEDLKKGLQKR